MQELTAQQYFRTLTIIFGALLMGLLMFTGVAYYLNMENHAASRLDSTNTYMIVVSLLAISCVIMSVFISANIIKAAKAERTLGRKLGRYRSAMIVKFALIEGPTLFAIVMYLQYGHINFLAVAALLIGIFIVNIPSKARAIKELELSDSEKKDLDDPETLIRIG